MKKRIILIVAFLVMLIALGGFGIYAYFNGLFHIQNQQITYEHNGNEIVIHNMNEFNQKINEFNQASVHSYVSTEQISANPVSLKLDADVVLTATKDIWITADCNINLNGGSINLNGYRLIIRHAYAGQIVLSNGTITSAIGAASVLIDAPNSKVVFENVTLSENVTKVEAALDSTMLYENALDYAYQQIANANGDFLQQLYVTNTQQQHFTCGLTDAVDSSCIYQLLGKDLDLLNYYYDIPITYESSDETIVSSKGNVLKAGSVSLKMTAGSQAREWNVHVLTNDEIPHGSIYTLLQELSSYYDEADAVYDFGGEILLPLTNHYFNKEYFYRVYEEDTTNAISNSSELFNYFEKPNLNGEFIILKLTNNLKYLGIEVDGVAVQIPIRGTSNGIHIDNNTYAKYIVYRNYGKGILIEGKKAADGTISYSYSSNPLGSHLCTYLNYDGGEGLNPYQVKYNGIQYKIVNDIDNVYTLDKAYETDESGVLVLKDATINIRKEPTAQIAYLEITIDFDNGLLPATVVTTIPIWYKEVTSEGSGDSQTVSGFRPYYLYFNREILNASEGYTYKSFEFPFTYNSNYPLYWVDFTLTNEDPNVDLTGLFTIKFELKYASEDPMVFTNYEDYKQYVNSLSADNRKKLLDTRPYFQAVIDPTKIPFTNTKVTLNYHYSFVEDGLLDENGNNMWHDYTEETTSFVICGIVRNDATGIPNQKLYQTVYDQYKVVEEDYIISDWLDAEKETLSFENETTIDNYKGLEYLTGLKKINMNNCGISNYTVDQFATLAGYLSQMTSLEELFLANNSIKDRNAMSNIIPFPTGTDNGFVEKLSALTNLRFLHLENNKIYQFRGIQNFESLETVYVYNNTFSSSWSFLDEALGVNDIYGSTGEINQAYYVQIYTKNVTVVWKENVNFVPTASSSKFTSLINSLMNLEYQYMIPEGQDISMVYNHLSTNTTDYSEEPLSNSRGDNVGVDKMEFVPVLEGGATTATTTQFRAVYTYEFFYDGGIFGGGEGQVVITIDMVYDVMRY